MNEHSALHLPGSADTGAESLLSASDLGVRREGKWLIRNVDLAIGPGEIVSVVGPNGGGKTTLIKALVGIEPAVPAGSYRRAACDSAMCRSGWPSTGRCRSPYRA
jgi:ABC-type molybdenum transport system ATPase subunit/photorepair protein PhrA